MMKHFFYSRISKALLTLVFVSASLPIALSSPVGAASVPPKNPAFDLRACSKLLSSPIVKIDKEEMNSFVDALLLASRKGLTRSAKSELIENLPSRFRESLTRRLKALERFSPFHRNELGQTLLELIGLHGSDSPEVVRAIFKLLKQDPSLMITSAHELAQALATVDPTGKFSIGMLVSMTQRRWGGLRPPDRFDTERASNVLSSLARLSIESPASVSNDFVLEIARNFSRMNFQYDNGQDTSFTKFELFQNIKMALEQRGLEFRGLVWTDKVPVEPLPIIDDALRLAARKPNATYELRLGPNGMAQLGKIGSSEAVAEWRNEKPMSDRQSARGRYSALGPTQKPLIVRNIGESGIINNDEVLILGQDGVPLMKLHLAPYERNIKISQDFSSDSAARDSLVMDLLWLIKNSPVEEDLSFAIKALGELRKGQTIEYALISLIAEISRTLGASSSSIAEFFGVLPDEQMPLLIELLARNEIHHQYITVIAERKKAALKPLKEAMGSSNREIRNLAYEIYFNNYTNFSETAGLSNDFLQLYRKEPDELCRQTMLHYLHFDRNESVDSQIHALFGEILTKETSKNVLEQVVVLMQDMPSQSRYKAYQLALEQLETNPDAQVVLLASIEKPLLHPNGITIIDSTQDHLNIVLEALRSKNRATADLGIEVLTKLFSNTTRSAGLAAFYTKVISDPGISLYHREVIRSRLAPK